MIGFELLSIEPENVPDAIGQLIKNGGRMQMVYGWQPDDGHLELRYLASRAVKQDFLVLRCVPHGPIPSVAGISPLLDWHEREISDLFGFGKPIIAVVNSFTQFGSCASNWHSPDNRKCAKRVS